MRVAIIGAGASGLTSIKCCLDDGITPVCYERTGYIGGLWRYVPEERCGSSVYKSTVINTSKEMMCYSDYPIPEDFPNFMHNPKVYEYFKMYAKEFNLYDHINFNTTVLKCEPAEDFKTSGNWWVTTKQNESDKEKRELFNGLFVCIGHHAEPHYPLHEFEGIEKFKGEYLHSHSYRTPEKFADKRIMVVGAGNSGMDISVELCQQAKQVYYTTSHPLDINEVLRKYFGAEIELFLSARRGAWVFNRVADNGLPGDVVGTTRLSALIMKLAPNLVAKGIKKRLNQRFDHELYGMKPDHGIWAQHGTVNDDLPNKILNGRIKVKRNIKHFTETGVVFEDGSFEEIDAVVFATGYKYDFPFLSDDILKVESNVTSLYKLVWPATLDRNTLAVIGNIQPLGAINPIAELQARCALKVIKGETILPSRNEMLREIKSRKDAMSAQYVKSPRHTLQVFYVSYMDELADIIKCKPNVLKYIFTDPALAIKVFFGPTTPYQYRLEGPGKWSQARDMIMSQMDRVEKPLLLKPRVKKNKSNNMIIISFIISLVALWFFN